MTNHRAPLRKRAQMFQPGTRRTSAMFALLWLAIAPATTNAASLDEVRRALAARDWLRAESQLQSLNAVESESADADMLRATLAHRQGDVTRAEALLNELHRRYPGLPEPLNNLAVIAAETGHTEDARQLLEQALETHAGYAAAYRNLGDIYAQLAADAYAKALNGESGRPATRLALDLVDRLSPVFGCAPSERSGNE